MENAGFGSSGAAGEEMERALMDLGPLLGVTIKEETPDDIRPEPAAAQPSANSVSESAQEPILQGNPPDAICVLCRGDLAAPSAAPPKLMECLHSVCDPCLKAKVDEKLASNMQRDFLGAERITITCPACRLQCQAANMIEQRFVVEKVVTPPGPEPKYCASCEEPEPAPATAYCQDCGDFICDSCVNAHQRLKITKDHTIKSKEEALAELQASSKAAHEMYCRDHPQERLSLFCESCDRLTCRDCQLQHHRDHKYQFSEEMAQQARTQISSLLSEVSYKRVLLGSAMKVIKERQQLIADKKKALVHDITQTVVKLTNAINSRGKQLVLRLSEVCESKQRTLAEKKEALDHLASITDHCVNFVSAALDTGSDTAVLYSKRCVCAHLQRIKSRRADIPNPEIPVRISLALDHLPHLLQAVSSLGAIVVDGKVDGAGASGNSHPPHVGAPGHSGTPGLSGSSGHAGTPGLSGNSGHAGTPGASCGAPSTPPAQGPYHPPHSAVMALQHAAMHQQGYPGSPSNVGGVNMGQINVNANVNRGRPAVLRHHHVTSTTHPHHLHGMNEMNLRGLLNAGGHLAAVGMAVNRATRPNMQYNPQNNMQHAYHQMLNAYQGYLPRRGQLLPARSPSPRPAPPAASPAPPLGGPPPQPQPVSQHQQAKWHIPQQHNPTAVEPNSMSSANDSFKITLSRPASGCKPPIVTSTNPQTPSPTTNGAASSELDKVCQESVQELLATLARLDAHGVHVVAEHAAPSPEPSSSRADPNEDWCAVCMDGGELVCCDHCPKVFHQYCHIPTIEKLPDESESWQCMLCVNLSSCSDTLDGEQHPGAGAGGLGPKLKVVERITLELYCQYELSLAFREPVPTYNTHYYSKITRPMFLDWVRGKLQPRSPVRYTNVAQFVRDCRLIFRNAQTYNMPESQLYKDAVRLEEFFDAQLAKWLPEYVNWNGEATGSEGDPTGGLTAEPSPAKIPRVA